MNIKELTLDEYRELVAYLSNEKSHDVIDNDTVEHASILVKALVESAEDTIRLYTTSFCEAFYSRPEIKEAFKNAAEKNVTLRVISRNDLARNEVFTDYKKIFNSHIQTAISADGIQGIGNDGTPIILKNFMLIDKHGIRYEQGSDQTKCENLVNVNARASFNRPSDVEYFIEKFEKRING